MSKHSTIIKEFKHYVNDFVELTTTDEYNHRTLEAVDLLIDEYRDNLRIMFNRCHTLIHSCDACTIRKTCKQLRDIDKKVGA